MDKIIDFDSKKISWTLALKNNADNNKLISYNPNSIILAYYRPFYKINGYFNRSLNEVVGTIPKLFPTPTSENKVICVSGVGVTKDFSTWVFCVILNTPILLLKSSTALVLKIFHFNLSFYP